MQTRTALSTIYGQDSGGFSTRLADIADELVAAHEQREETRMAAAELRDNFASRLPFVHALQHALVASQQETLTDNRLPAVMRFDAYCAVKDASKNDPSDRGLKHASIALQHAWNQDPMGHFTVGELVSYRNHFASEFPKSAVKHTFDYGVPAVGFNTLTNLSFLTRVASDVVDQHSYEAAVEAHGLDGDRPEQIRARAYIRALADLAGDDSYAATPMPTVASAIERAILRYSQVDQQDINAGEPTMSMALQPGEEALPHDENEEEMATIESPISGEQLTVELGTQDGSIDGMTPEEDEFSVQQSAPSGGLPRMEPMMMSGQMADPSDETVGLDEPSEPDDDLDDDLAMGGEDIFDETLSEEAGEGTTRTTIVDPTSGELLEMTLSVPDQDDEGVAGMPEDGLDNDIDSPELSPDDMNGLGAEASAPRGWKKTVEHMKNHSEVDNPFALANWMKERGYKPHTASMHTADTTTERAMNPEVKGQPEAAVSYPAPLQVLRPKKEKKARGLSVDEVTRTCAALGITAASVESALIAGDKLAVGEWMLHISASDDVELRRLTSPAFEMDIGQSRLVRSAGLIDLDAVVADFMALAASTVVTSTEVEQTRAIERVATQQEALAPKAYVISTDIPHGAPINARRMMAQVWRVDAAAEGEIIDGRLAILVKNADDKSVNRIRTVLRDVFGAQRVEAQRVDIDRTAQLAPQPQPAPQMGPQLTPPTDQNSPFLGQTPVSQQPAGAPAQPLQAPMQTPNTGTGAQSNFIADHTDPFAQHAEGDEFMDDDDGGDMSGDGAIYAQAQMPPDEMGGGVGEEMGGGMPSAQPGGVMPPMPNPSMMGDGQSGGMPGMPGAPGGTDPGMMVDPSAMGMNPNESETIRSAFNIFHNDGMPPLEALAKFWGKFSAIVEKYGDALSPQRLAAEAEVLKLQQEEYAKPVVVPAKNTVAASARTAEMPTPRRIQPQHGGKVTVKKDFPEGDMPEAPAPRGQHGKPQGDFSNTDMHGHGDTSGHPSGLSAPLPPADGQRGKPHNKGERFSDTSHRPDMSSGENATTTHWDTVSRSEKMRSTRRADVIVHFDHEYGKFEVLRDGKRIATNHDSYASALADAERRIFGTDGKIYVDDGRGGLDEV